MKITEKYVFFWSGVFSQWYSSSFIVDGITYNTAEQWMMVEKARLFLDDHALQKILESSDPRTQKAWGRKVRNFDSSVWDSKCQEIVYRGNLHKFKQNPILQRALFDAAGATRIFVEASPKDVIWGIGLSAGDPRSLDPKQWRGKNYLGIALTRVRDTLLQELREKETKETKEIKKKMILSSVKETIIQEVTTMKQRPVIEKRKDANSPPPEFKPRHVVDKGNNNDDNDNDNQTNKKTRIADSAGDSLTSSW